MTDALCGDRTGAVPKNNPPKKITLQVTCVFMFQTERAIFLKSYNSFFFFEGKTKI